ncbi:MAG: DUF58 domain-containing protein [Magnetococcales bacterium]|nr:DUF58 domain-containing protein [Magnetococcales bacterium]NGZ28723.1 DUF58 domain-containing protein [Magnetococcales bacterium]
MERKRRPIFRRFIMLPSFAFFTRASHRLGGRVTGSGRVVVLGLLACGLFSVDTTRTQAYQLFSLLCGLMLLAMLFSWRFKSQVHLIRRVPPHATLGLPFPCVVEVVNHGNQEQRELTLGETPPHSTPTLLEFLHYRQPGEEKRNWFDRHVAFERFVWLSRQKQGFHAQTTPLPPLPSQGRCQVTLEITPHRRGRVQLPGPHLLRPDPLGLFLARENHPQSASILVLPKRYRLPAGFTMPGHRRHQPGGLSLVSTVGEAEEFIGLREYRPGDTLRRIHWPGLARHGQLLVREYQEEYFTRYGLILDTFTHTGEDPARFEEAVSLAASFSAVVEAGDALLELLFVGQTAYHFTAGRGIAHAAQILEILACVEETPQHPFQQLSHLVVSQASLLGGCVLILLHWDEEREKLVEKLSQWNLPLLILRIAENTHLPFPPPLHHPASRCYTVAPGQGGEILAGILP